jgi:anti-sigma factor (TIGR02949 family)
VDCREIEKFVQVYIDGELDAEDQTIIEEHLRQCPACLAQVDYERRFIKAVKIRVPKVAAPVSFKTQLVANMGKAPKQRPLSRRLMWSSIPAAAALALVITFTWTVTSGFSPLVSAAVEQHSLEPDVDVNTSDSATVENWFKKKVDFNVTLPRFQTRKANLIGARLSRLAEQRAALIRYRSGIHQFSLFVVSDNGGELDTKTCQRVKTREFCVTERKGYTVVIWRSRGLIYSLVGDSAPQEMMDVISSDSSF